MEGRFQILVRERGAKSPLLEGWKGWMMRWWGAFGSRSFFLLSRRVPLSLDVTLNSRRRKKQVKGKERTPTKQKKTRKKWVNLGGWFVIQMPAPTSARFQNGVFGPLIPSKNTRPPRGKNTNHPSPPSFRPSPKFKNSTPSSTPRLSFFPSLSFGPSAEAPWHPNFR